MKLLLADDHTLFRDALVQYIVRAEPDAAVSLAKDLYEAMALLESGVEPDLVLLDLRMPGMDGMNGFRILREKYPDIRVALMSGVAESYDVKQAMELGAVAYFPKTLSGKAMLKALQLVLAGERYLPIEHATNEVMPSYYNGLERPGGESGAQPPYPHVRDFSAADPLKITARERDVLVQMAKGYTNKEIADVLNLQLATVKLHVRGVCRKLGARNRTEAALKARELGFATAS
ncbi:MAG: response regulator transcription factor [Rhodospirillales bacterium]|nr:response regulator transcription factor [Rhodospirillales bacterium]